MTPENGYPEICRTTRFRREHIYQKEKERERLVYRTDNGIPTGTTVSLVVVFPPGTVNRLTTNRRDLHGITDTFAINLLACDRCLLLTAHLGTYRAYVIYSIRGLGNNFRRN